MLFRGPPFITYLDNLPTVVREDNGIFRMPIADKYKVRIAKRAELGIVQVSVTKSRIAVVYKRDL